MSTLVVHPFLGSHRPKAAANVAQRCAHHPGTNPRHAFFKEAGFCATPLLHSLSVGFAACESDSERRAGYSALGISLLVRSGHPDSLKPDSVQKKEKMASGCFS
ncbi:hypothetical protein CEXT_312811 [Caerostris extrusa]|uniref:Uncharacterized protein n=1 Tax=Caerostris extrusa TaxID=172846 RepID=A0AAV4S9U4_CAEEX|nr:hypothetical protein CEXT_312811 [Caerostris extrusa]